MPVRLSLLLLDSLWAQGADPHQTLRAFEDDYFQFYLCENPESATQLGEYRYNNQLTDFSLAHIAQLKRELTALRARLQNTHVTSESDQLDRTLLLRFWTIN